MEQAALKALQPESNEPAPDTVRERAPEKFDYQSTANDTETAAKVLELPRVQKGMNALVDQLDGSWAMKPIETVWNALPGWAQKGSTHYLTRFLAGASPMGITASGFEKLARAGLLEYKDDGKQEIDLTEEERGEAEEKFRKMVGDVAKVATGGEASGLVDAIFKVLNAQDNLLDGARAHLAETRAQKKTEELRQDINQTA